MKNMKTVKALLLAAVLLCSVVLLTACGGTAEPTYKVTVKDALGNPYTSGVIVKFLQDGQQVAMQKVNENGVAEKQLPKGDYTVELMFTDSDAAFYYDKAAAAVSADKTELEIVLTFATGEDAQTLNAQGKECQAYPVSTGSTYVKLTPGERSYFLFTPTQAGMYEFSVSTEDTAIGYYGAPHFVQELSAAEVVDNKFSVSVKAAMIGTNGTGTTVMVIGIDSQTSAETVLNIVRTGDPEHTVEDEPWSVYQATATLAPYTLPAGSKLADFDITKTAGDYKLVLNETDGFYHLNTADGPLVLCKLGEKAKPDYLDPFQKIVDRSGVVKYFYNADGEFEKKESYTECLIEYIKNMDETSGLYPLTEDLKYIIQQRGDHSGWFDADSAQYLFKDQNGDKVPGVNSEISWLFMCCYIEG